MEDTKLKYKDIINLNKPNYSRKKMTNLNRASQFAPFSALSGHKESMDEQARNTDEIIEYDEDTIDNINRILNIILSKDYNGDTVNFTVFIKDEYKSGGSYQNIIGVIKKYDEEKKEIHLISGDKVKIKDITNVYLC